MPYSTQGFRVAFIGTNYSAQTACAEYLKKEHSFKRVNMENALNTFIKTSFWKKKKEKLTFIQKIAFYDAIYKVNPEIFIKYTEGLLDTTPSDIVIWNVRYLNEMRFLKEQGFIICRVTSGIKSIHIGKYVNTADKESLALILQFGNEAAIKNIADYSVTWTNFASTKPIMDAFLERIGYNLDLSQPLP